MANIEKKYVILQGSARTKGNTQTGYDRIFSPDQRDVFPLAEMVISHYRYDGQYPVEDEFISLISTLLSYEFWVFATPVYWYSMSGLMKVFLDRITDLVTTHKPLGRLLLGKKTFLVVTSSNGMPEYFLHPFKDTCQYMKMHYCGEADFIFPENTPEKIEHNLKQQKQALEKLMLS